MVAGVGPGVRMRSLAGQVAGRDLLLEPRDEAGSQQGRLAASRGAEQHRETVVADQRVEVGDHPVAAEEQVPVGGFEAGEAPVRRRRAVVVRLRRLGGAVRLCLGLLPARAPLRRVAVAGPHVPLDHGERRQPFVEAAAWDSVVAEKPAAFAIVRYDGPPAARRSSRNACASPCTAPARGSTGRSGRPMRVPPYT